jgi:hypothetical protein
MTKMGRSLKVVGYPYLRNIRFLQEERGFREVDIR